MLDLFQSLKSIAVKLTCSEEINKMENIKEGKESDIDGDKLISVFFFFYKFLSDLQRNYL